MRLAINVVVFLTLSLLPSESQTLNITIGQWLEENDYGNLTLKEIKKLPFPLNRKDESAPAATQTKTASMTEKKPTSSNQPSSQAQTARTDAVEAKPSTQPTTRANTSKTTTKEGKPSTQSTTLASTKITTTEEATPSTQSTTQASTKITTIEEAEPSTAKAPVAQSAPGRGNTTAENGNTTAENGNITAENGNITAGNGNTTAENGNTTAENGNATTENGNTTKVIAGDKSNPSKSQGDIFKWIKQRTNFPVLFMVILVVIVVIYFGYHNRNKIRRFLGEGYGKAKQRGKGYLKVKVEDLEDIELPRDANRQYVY